MGIKSFFLAWEFQYILWRICMCIVYIHMCTHWFVHSILYDGFQSLLSNPIYPALSIVNEVLLDNHTLYSGYMIHLGAYMHVYLGASNAYLIQFMWHATWFWYYIRVQIWLLSWKLRWNPNIRVWKVILLFTFGMFGFQVGFEFRSVYPICPMFGQFSNISAIFQRMEGACEISKIISSYTRFVHNSLA